MKALQPIAWREPLECAAHITDAHMVLLYSSTQTSYSGRYSYLAFDLKEHLAAENFTLLSTKLSHAKPWFENAWFGYLGYGLKNTLETLPDDANPSIIPLPNLYMMRFGTIWRFDHQDRIIERWSDSSGTLPEYSSISHTLPQVSTLQSNMSNASYMQKVRCIIDSIHAGDLYQANLTRKFYGEFVNTVDSFTLFAKLCTVSPAPYSAYIRINDISVCSSSPELFLRISHGGAVETRPIKGTSPRMPDAETDRKSLEQLANSEKDKAENLMITDLMRNDLSRTCIAGSIKVQDMFAVTSHSNVHHMASTVRGQKKPEHSTLDVVTHCFPAGSMTGAPKIKAITLCTALENMARGVYSGAIGFMDGAGGCELSVIIRTIIIHGKKFEFQVGGGIVADSTPEAEMQETFDKAKGIIKALEIAPQVLETL